MREIDAHNAAEYLRQTGRVGPQEEVTVRELGGGVSNVVLYVHRDAGAGGDFVLKQARGQLRTAAPWFCSVERIRREVAVMRSCQALLASVPAENSPAKETGGRMICTPDVLFEDADNYLYAMSAAPPAHVMWRSQLLSSQADPQIAAACGQLLGRLHAGTWRDPATARQFGDRGFFDDLRLDPYYRQIARVHADLRPAIDRLLASLDQNATCLVHGDYSPKNLLVYDGGLMMVDFEVGHYGDPAFDLGFFLSHLVLKAAYHAPRGEPFLVLTEVFWRAYRRQLSPRVDNVEQRALEARGVQNFAGCALARLDGKSPVDYLTDQRRREQIRQLCRRLFHDEPDTWDEVLSRVRESLE